MKKSRLYLTALLILFAFPCFAISLENPRKAAEQGDADSQILLGVTYYNEKNYAEAIKWYRKAAEQGNPNAQILLGSMYALGEGIPEDYVTAYMWCSIAAAKNPSDADAIDILEKEMTPDQIARGKHLAQEWIKQHPIKPINQIERK